MIKCKQCWFYGNDSGVCIKTANSYCPRGIPVGGNPSCKKCQHDKSGVCSKSISEVSTCRSYTPTSFNVKKTQIHVGPIIKENWANIVLSKRSKSTFWYIIEPQRRWPLFGQQLPITFSDKSKFSRGSIKRNWNILFSADGYNPNVVFNIDPGKSYIKIFRDFQSSVENVPWEEYKNKGLVFTDWYAPKSQGFNFWGIVINPSSKALLRLGIGDDVVDEYLRESIKEAV